MAGYSMPDALNAARSHIFQDKPEVLLPLGQLACYIQTPEPAILNPKFANIREKIWKLISSDGSSWSRKYLPKIVKYTGTAIFDWLLIEAIKAIFLGEGEKDLHLQPLPIEPYCSSLSKTPIFKWNLPGDADEFFMQIYSDETGKIPFFEKEFFGVRLMDPGEFDLKFSENVLYNWSITFKENGKWIVRNGLFNILPQSKVTSFQDDLQALNNYIVDSEYAKKLFRAGILLESGQYDVCIDELFTMLRSFTADAAKVPPLILLREVYQQMSERFNINNLVIELDHVRKRIIAAEEDLDEIYDLEPDVEVQNEDD